MPNIPFIDKIPFIDQAMVEAYGLPVFIGFWVIVILLFVLGLRRKKKGRIKKVRAQVVDKRRQEYNTRYAGQQVRYVVVFLVGRRKLLSFFVTEATYDGFVLAQRGVLKYNGDRILDFKPI